MKYEEPKIIFNYWAQEEVMTASGENLKDDCGDFDATWL